MTLFALVLHGGAGTIARAALGAEAEAAHRADLEAALRAGAAVLAAGGAALDAAEAAVVILEDSPRFNAGRGSVFAHDGQVSMDASIMDGATGAAGAVAGVRSPRNPIRAARAVMEASPHVFLAGEGADAFIRAQGLPIEPQRYFHTARRREQLQRARDADEVQLDHGSEKFGTVGAVALDQRGRIAAATSTGGMTNKRWGRVGDSPLIAAGTWADARVGISCTGHGEFFIRAAAAHAVAARVRFGGASLAAAAQAVIAEDVGARGGTGGLIALDATGAIAAPFNSGGMYRGWIRADQPPVVRIWAQ